VRKYSAMPKKGEIFDDLSRSIPLIVQARGSEAPDVLLITYSVTG
jgi:hypothetical protein